MVRGDPRHHMKKHFQFLHFESAALVPKAGIVAEQIRPLYKNGDVIQTVFMYAACTNALSDLGSLPIILYYSGCRCYGVCSSASSRRL